MHSGAAVGQACAEVAELGRVDAGVEALACQSQTVGTGRSRIVVYRRIDEKSPLGL
jgi:hypothetical protein